MKDPTDVVMTMTLAARVGQTIVDEEMVGVEAVRLPAYQTFQGKPLSPVPGNFFH